MEKFSTGAVPTGKKGSVIRERIEEILSENDEQAFTARELADMTDANTASINQAVRKLEEGGKVERKVVDGRIYNRWLESGAEEAEEEE